MVTYSDEIFRYLFLAIGQPQGIAPTKGNSTSESIIFRGSCNDLWLPIQVKSFGIRFMATGQPQGIAPTNGNLTSEGSCS